MYRDGFKRKPGQIIGGGVTQHAASPGQKRVSCPPGQHQMPVKSVPSRSNGGAKKIRGPFGTEGSLWRWAGQAWSLQLPQMRGKTLSINQVLEIHGQRQGSPGPDLPKEAKGQNSRRKTEVRLSFPLGRGVILG